VKSEGGFKGYKGSRKSETVEKTEERYKGKRVDIFYYWKDNNLRVFGKAEGKLQGGGFLGGGGDATFRFSEGERCSRGVPSRWPVVKIIMEYSRLSHMEEMKRRLGPESQFDLQLNFVYFAIDEVGRLRRTT